MEEPSNIVDTASYIAHNNHYVNEKSLNYEISIHNMKTNAVLQKNSSKWDNLYKPGHLHGEWLDKNKILYDKQSTSGLSVNEYNIKCAVDIGSGTGWFVNYLASYYKFEKIYGIEPSEEAINIAKKIYKNSKVNYIIGFAEEKLKSIKLEEPTLFTTFIVLSHISDNSVIQILKEMDNIAPPGSIFIFNENFDNIFNQNLWHCRSQEWWKQNLSNWELTFDERPRPDLQYYKQGLMGVKNKL